MRPRTILLLAVLVLTARATASAQTLTSFERSRALGMLDAVHDDIKKHYFDSTYGGVDIAAIFDTARSRIQRATRIEETLYSIAQATIDINDGHTLFLPPTLAYRADYGWSMAFFGDTCRVVSVRPESDAARQGVLPGDAIFRIEGIVPTRRNLFYIRYMISAVFPRQSLRVLLRHPGGTTQEMALGAEVKEHRRVYDLTGDHADIWELIRESQNADDSLRSSSVEFDNNGPMVWRYRSFDDGKEVEEGLKRARGRPALVLDLRDNPGGLVVTLLKLLNGVYRDSTTIANVQDRKERKPEFVRGSGERAYGGRLIVLVDSRSASASEAFARSVQLTGRGTVVGDLTMGALRTSRGYSHQIGTQTVVAYGTRVAIEDLVFPDGSQVEGKGVLPDIAVLPSGEDLRERRDPALAHALGLIGVTMSPTQAAALLRRP